MSMLLLASAALAILTYTAALPTETNTLQSLSFTEQDEFQIAIFEDLHFGENAWEHWGHQQDVWSQYAMNQVLDSETPQLAVLNGDLITGENGFLENSTVYVDQIVKPLVDHKLGWASTYGNHDSQYNLSREGILEREHMWPGARTTKMVFSPKAGVSNYYLPVYPYGCDDCGMAPELILWFFDSRGGSMYQQLDDEGNQIPQEDWVDQSVVDWFQATSEDLHELHGKTIPSLAFVHIPTQASHVFQTEESVDPHKETGRNDDYPLAQQAQGWCSDGTTGNPDCKYGGQDRPFMEALVSTPGLMAVFSGHDHGDSWCYKWDSQLPGMDITGNGVNLCFGQRSGYGGYGSWIRGSRQILVTKAMLKDFEMDTWIRLEDKSVVGSVSLNATYGQDNYTETPYQETHCPTC